MKARWLYVGIVMLLFLILVLGVPLFPGILATPIAGWFNLGMLIYLLLCVTAPLLAFVYLKQRSREDS